MDETYWSMRGSVLAKLWPFDWYQEIIPYRLWFFGILTELEEKFILLI